jgi:hypothetical protein
MYRSREFLTEYRLSSYYLVVNSHLPVTLKSLCDWLFVRLSILYQYLLWYVACYFSQFHLY